MENILECKKICKSFGRKRILKDVSFSIAPGDILAFIGPNGSGKTTTIKLILGLQKIDSGSVILNGFNVATNYVKAIERVGAIVENPDSYMYLTGWQNLRLIADCYPNISDEQIKKIVSYVGLTERINDKVSKYSLGMRQRLGIARALLNSPDILILDEPTNGLDPEGINDLRNLLKKLAGDGMGILISSHNLAELESFCNKVCIINHGQIIESSSIKDFKYNANRVFFRVNDTTALPLTDAMEITKNSFVVTADEKKVAKIVRQLVRKKIEIYEIRQDELSLEEAFLKKTGGNKNV